MQVRPDVRRLAQRRDELVVDVVDLDRRQAQALDPVDRAGCPDQPRERVAGLAVAEAAEVDAGEDDLAMALRDAGPDLAEDVVGAAAARRAAHERDDAEVARERAAVLDLDERADAIEPRVRPDTADRADVAGDLLDRLLDLPADDGHVRRQPRERGLREPGAAARHEDAVVRACRTRGGLPRLRERLVRDAAGVDDGDLACALDVAVAEQPLAHRLRVGVGDLAAEEGDREPRHLRT